MVDGEGGREERQRGEIVLSQLGHCKLPQISEQETERKATEEEFLNEYIQE